MAWVHPAWMIGTLAAALVTLRLGLRLRSARRRGTEMPAGVMRWHLRLAKPTVVLVLVGFIGGPISMALLRGRSPFETAHAFVATAAAALFVAVAWIGRRRELRRGGDPDLHGALGVFAMLVAAAAAITGFVLLP